MKSDKKGLFLVTGVIGAVLVFLGIGLALIHLGSFISVMIGFALFALIMVICKKGNLANSQVFLAGSLYCVLFFVMSGVLGIYSSIKAIPQYMIVNSDTLLREALRHAYPIYIGIGLILCLLSYMKLVGFRKEIEAEQGSDQSDSR